MYHAESRYVNQAKSSDPKARLRAARYLVSTQLVQLVNDPDDEVRREIARRIIWNALPLMAYDENLEVRGIVAKRVKGYLTPAIHQISELPVEQWTFKETEFLPQLFLLATLSAKGMAALLARMPPHKFRVVINAEYWRNRMDIVPFLPISHLLEMAKDTVSNVRIEAIRRLPVDCLPALLDAEADDLAIDFILERMRPGQVPAQFMDRYSLIIAENVMGA